MCKKHLLSYKASENPPVHSNPLNSILIASSQTPFNTPELAYINTNTILRALSAQNTHAHLPKCLERGTHHTILSTQQLKSHAHAQPFNSAYAELRLHLSSTLLTSWHYDSIPGARQEKIKDLAAQIDMLHRTSKAMSMHCLLVDIIYDTHSRPGFAMKRERFRRAWRILEFFFLHPSRVHRWRPRWERTLPSTNFALCMQR